MMTQTLEQQTAHTSGPWEALPNGNRGNHIIQTKHGGWREMPIAFTATHFVSGNEPANAQLIAAAPAMLAALEKAEATFRHYGDLHAAKPDEAKAKRNYDLADEFRAAIARAKGAA